MALADGNLLSAADYLIYAAPYKATPTTLTAGSEAGTPAIDQTDISVNIAGSFTSADGAMLANEIVGLYTGYVATYTVGGSSVTATTVQAATKA